MQTARRTSQFGANRSGDRGSLLITALLFSAVLGVALVSYLSLSRNALQVARRTLYVTDATNLAESGLEEALYCFKQAATSAGAVTAWTGWTISGKNALRTLDSVDRNQHAIGTVKVYVKGYSGGDTDPYVIAQATITPFDGSKPIVKVLRINLGMDCFFANGLVGINGISINKSGSSLSYDSNPTDSPTGPWKRYSTSLDRSKSSMVVVTGNLSVPSNYPLKGDLYLGSGVSKPSSLSVSGTIYTNYNGIFPMPDYPTAASVSQSENLSFSSPSSYWKSRRWWWLGVFRRHQSGYLPLTLPESGDLPAADGRYYYFCDKTTIGNLTIASGKNVTIVGTNTDMTGGLYLQTKSTLQIYIDGAINIGGWKNSDYWRNAFTAGDSAGALKLFTTTTQNCLINCDYPVYACVYAPNATLNLTGGWGTGWGNKSGDGWDKWGSWWWKRFFSSNAASDVVGSFVGKKLVVDDNIDFIFDEALLTSGAGRIWSLKGWSELNPLTEKTTIGTLTGDFLP